MKKRIVVICLLVLAPYVSAASNFVTVKLPRGVELQLPKGWWMLTAELNQLIDMSAEAAMDLSGINAPEGTEVNLIAANSMPRTTYAAVRVDSTTPVSGPPSEIANLTSADIKAFESEMRSNLQKLLPQQGNQLMEFFGVHQAAISGHPTLITEYRRSGPKGPVMVSIIQIFSPSQDLRINLSYREAEQAIWKPVIRKIYQSIVIRRWP
jgi:hypothetical protein